MKLILILLLLILYSCNEKQKEPLYEYPVDISKESFPSCPEIGDLLNTNLYQLPINSSQIMTHSSQLRPFVQIYSKGIKYTVAYDDKYYVQYVETRDKNFKSIEGYKINDTLFVSKNDINRIPGWRYYGGITKDNWNIIGADYPDSVINDKDSAKIVIKGFAKGGS